LILSLGNLLDVDPGFTSQGRLAVDVLLPREYRDPRRLAAWSADAAARPVVLEPPASGSIFRVVDFPPDKDLLGKLDRGKAFEAMGAHGAMDRDASRHPGMHRTRTVDYALVLDGEIWALMDEGEVLLKAGDCLIQRGTNHAWANRSDRPCRVAFILIDARPL